MAKNKTAGANSGVRAVAEAAGVSKTTVSRAFNEPEMVKEEVRLKIFEVAARMNYRPHPAARALRSRRTHIIGAAIPTLDYAIFAQQAYEKWGGSGVARHLADTKELHREASERSDPHMASKFMGALRGKDRLRSASMKILSELQR